MSLFIMPKLKDIAYLTTAFMICHNRLRHFLAAHTRNSLWAFLFPGVFKVFDRVGIAGQKISKWFMSTNANPGNDLQSRQPGHTATRELSPVFS